MTFNDAEAPNPCCRENLAYGRPACCAEPTMTQKHTPRPWHIRRGEFICSSDGGTIARIGTPSTPVKRRDANARLIAAAPEMLAALRAALELATIQTNRSGSHGTLAYKTSQILIDAIAATGGRDAD